MIEPPDFFDNFEKGLSKAELAVEKASKLWLIKHHAEICKLRDEYVQDMRDVWESSTDMPLELPFLDFHDVCEYISILVKEQGHTKEAK